MLYCIIYSVSVTDDSAGTVAGSKVEKSPGFLFILQYPVHSTVAVCFSILYEYICFELIKKTSYKYLFLTQLTGLFWYNLYSLREGVTTLKYFATFTAFVALIMLSRVVSGDRIYSRIVRLRKWFKRKEQNGHSHIVEEK